MDNNQITPERKEQIKKAVVLGHFPYMTQALAVAYERVPAWRLAGTGAPCSILDVFQSAKKMDERRPRKDDDPSFYYVSLEGAIGYCPTGLEFQVVWLFFPMEPGEERDNLMKKVKEEYDRVEAELKAKAEAEAAPAPVKHFCPNCGAPIKKPNAKFCSSCGNPL